MTTESTPAKIGGKRKSQECTKNEPSYAERMFQEVTEKLQDKGKNGFKDIIKSVHYY